MLDAAPALSLPAAGALPDSLSSYLPRPLLSRAPQPTGPVMLEWPDTVAEQSSYHAVLALFIDEAGLVRLVRLEEGELPDTLLSIARQAFLDARFLPGEWGGQPVRSRLLVEVSYEQQRPTEVAARGRADAGLR